MTILPQPKKLKKTGGVISVANLKIVLTAKCDDRIFRAAQKLANEMYEETGNKPVLTKAYEAPDIDGKVFFTAPSTKPYYGQMVKVKIEDCMDLDLVGEMID